MDGTEGATQDSIFDHNAGTGEEPTGLRTRSQAAKGAQRPGAGAAAAVMTGATFSTHGTPFGQQQPQWDLLTAEELEKYNRQVREERSKITYPQNPSLFPQSLRVQRRK